LYSEIFYKFLAKYTYIEPLSSSHAVLTFGLSSEYAGATKEKVGAPDADRTLYSRYYVRSLLKLDEDALKNAWSKVR
jgi:hypothetical protein